MSDEPIAHTKDGRPLFDNTPTVVCVVLFVHGAGVLTVRRNQNPGQGLLGLPGGYHMRGESWQEAGCRDLREETGVVLRPDALTLETLVTDEYGNNVVVALADSEFADLSGIIESNDEVQELVWTKVVDHDEWAFPLHSEAAGRTLWRLWGK